MTTTTARDYSLLLPPGWVRLPLDERVHDRVVTLATVQAREATPEHRDDVRRTLVRALGSAVSEAERAGGVDVLLQMVAVGDVAIAASCLVAFLSGQSSGLDAVEDELASEGGDVSLVTIAGALAVRRRMIVTSSGTTASQELAAAGLSFDAADVAPPVVSEQVAYFVPLPGTSDLLVFTFSTQRLEVADALARLFDAIMSTMRWLS